MSVSSKLTSKNCKNINHNCHQVSQYTRTITLIDRRLLCSRTSALHISRRKNEMRLSRSEQCTEIMSATIVPCKYIIGAEDRHPQRWEVHGEATYELRWHRIAGEVAEDWNEWSKDWQRMQESTSDGCEVWVRPIRVRRDGALRAAATASLKTRAPVQKSQRKYTGRKK